MNDGEMFVPEAYQGLDVRSFAALTRRLPGLKNATMHIATIHRWRTVGLYSPAYGRVVTLPAYKAGGNNFTAVECLRWFLAVTGDQPFSGPIPRPCQDVLDTPPPRAIPKSKREPVPPPTKAMSQGMRDYVNRELRKRGMIVPEPETAAPETKTFWPDPQPALTPEDAASRDLRIAKGFLEDSRVAKARGNPADAGKKKRRAMTWFENISSKFSETRAGREAKTMLEQLLLDQPTPQPKLPPEPATVELPSPPHVEPPEPPPAPEREEPALAGPEGPSKPVPADVDRAPAGPGRPPTAPEPSRSKSQPKAEETAARELRHCKALIEEAQELKGGGKVSTADRVSHRAKSLLRVIVSISSTEAAKEAQALLEDLEKPGQ